jgi:IclR family acetate operon transcriptional repressor
MPLFRIAEFTFRIEDNRPTAPADILRRLTDPAPERAPGGVQSISRAFGLLELMADNGGAATISELAQRSGLAVPTIHRLVRTMVDLGYVRQEPSRRYALAPRLVRLGESAGRLLGTWALPHLQHVVDAVGESANLALLDGHEMLYVAHVAGRHDMRMFTEVGRRAAPHCTAVGKAVLAELREPRVDEIVRAGGLAAQTPNTITDAATLKRELARIHEAGYATDEEEQEIGVRCIGVAVPSDRARAAVSISAPVGRMTDELIATAVPVLQTAARRLADDLASV